MRGKISRKSFIKLTAFTPFISVVSPASERLKNNHPALGINLAGIADWNTELPFIDVFRCARPWISQRKGADWGAGPQLSLDKHGWVLSLEPNCWAETLMCTIDDGHYPGGEYTVVYEGDGEIDFRNAAKIISKRSGMIKIEVDPLKGAIFLRLLRTNPQDPIRNICVLMPGVEIIDRNQPCWHERFIKRWKGIACIRFMDWMGTNGSEIKSWAQRPTPKDATFSKKGVPIEWMIDLCNRLEADAWFCIPHMANDEFIYHFVNLIKDRLNPNLKVYIEYSNELWNSIFPQYHYAAQMGQELGFGQKPWEAAWYYTAYRSIQIFEICKNELKDSHKLIRVISSQAANPYISEQLLNFHEAYKKTDALAIAPYISLNISPRSTPSAAEVASWRTEQLLDYIETVSLPQSISWMKQQKSIADKYGLVLVAYEGGQHLTGIEGAENNEQLTQLFIAANSHPRMGEIYKRYLNAWEKIGGDLFCHFSSVGKWSKWGCWGLIQYYDDQPSPKYKAVIEWAQKLGQKMELS